MYVRVQQQILSPGMQDGEDADLCTEALRVRRYFQQRGGSSGEQQVVKAAWILKRQHVQLMWNAENNMEVSSRQNFLFARGQPTLTRLCLALGAMPVTARVIRDGLMTASRTRVKVAAQSCCATVLDGAEDFQLLKAEARNRPDLKKAGWLLPTHSEGLRII